MGAFQPLYHFGYRFASMAALGSRLVFIDSAEEAYKGPRPVQLCLRYKLLPQGTKPSSYHASHDGYPLSCDPKETLHCFCTHVAGTRKIANTNSL